MENVPEFKDQLAAEGEDTDVLFKFVKKTYGRRCGPQGFCDFVNGVMCQKNLIRCEALPCFFWHENLHICGKPHVAQGRAKGRDRAEIL